MTCTICWPPSSAFPFPSSSSPTSRSRPLIDGRLKTPCGLTQTSLMSSRTSALSRFKSVPVPPPPCISLLGGCTLRKGLIAE